tara:strand:- start:1088 stop:1243 length:156 start_codon:yes stop_codon:yes gene_type:complete
VKKFYIFKDGDKIKETYVEKDAKRYKKKGYKVLARKVTRRTNDRKFLQLDK